MKVYARVNQGMSGKIAIVAYGEPHGPNIYPANGRVPGEHSEQQHCGMQCLYPSPR